MKRTIEPTKNLLITRKFYKNKHKAETLKLVRIGTKNIYLTADIGLTDRIWGENEPSLTCAFEGQE